MNKLAIAVVMSLAGTAFGQVPYLGGTYTENFDGLPSTVSTSPHNPWAQLLTLGAPDWFSTNSLPTASTGTSNARDPLLSPATQWNSTSVFRSGDGTSNAGALWDFGIAGVNPVTDRALGSVGSGTPGDFAFGVLLYNASPDTFTSFTLTFDGEQWRDGGAAVPNAQSLIFDFAVLNTFSLADASGQNTASYTSVSALNFTSPTFTNTGSGAALDGNAAANRTAGITSNVSVNWGPGQFLVLRWWDDNNFGNDHGLAIDNIGFSAAVPTPGAAALMGLGGLLASRRRRA